MADLPSFLTRGLLKLRRAVRPASRFWRGKTEANRPMDDSFRLDM